MCGSSINDCNTDLPPTFPPLLPSTPAATSGALGLLVVPEAIAPVPVACLRVTRCIAVFVADPVGRASLRAVGHWPRQHDLLPAGVGVKVIGPHVQAKHDVVIKIKEALGQARNVVKVCLNGRRRKCRQMGLVGEDVVLELRSEGEGVRRVV